MIHIQAWMDCRAIVGLCSRPDRFPTFIPTSFQFNHSFNSYSCTTVTRLATTTDGKRKRSVRTTLPPLHCSRQNTTRTAPLTRPLNWPSKCSARPWTPPHRHLTVLNSLSCERQRMDPWCRPYSQTPRPKPLSGGLTSRPPTIEHSRSGIRHE
jgi:hypothetical protein